MLINLKKSMLLSIFGSIFIVTHTTKLPTQSEELENLQDVEFIVLQEIPESSELQKTTGIQSRMIVERFKREDEGETTVAPETEAPQESDGSTKSPEVTTTDSATVPPEEPTPDITEAPNESLPAVEITTTKVQDLEAPVTNESTISTSRPLGAAAQVDLRKDIEDVAIDTAKFVIHVKDGIVNTVKGVVQKGTNKVRGAVGNAQRTLQGVGQTVSKTTSDITRGVFEILGFPRIVPAISDIISESTSNAPRQTEK